MSDWRVARSLNVLLAEINAAHPGRDKSNDGSIGDASHSSRVSDHNPNSYGVVCARDFTHDPEGGFDSYAFADWLARRVKNGQERRVKYIISNGRICSGEGQGHRPGVWRKYSGSLNQHDKHVHVSVRGVPSIYDDMSPWGYERKAT